jgi:hypothetical protein
MPELCIIACGKRKIWDSQPKAGPTPAESMYTGPFHNVCQQYARTFYPGAWCILSAKYGFLWPADIVQCNYDVSFNRPKTGPISVARLKDQACTERFAGYEVIVVLGGRRYADVVRQVFARKEIVTPLEGMSSNGMMMHEMNLAVEQGARLGSGAG